MKKIAVYPGTFDPITFGHIDVIKKALKLFDKVIIAASEGTNKNYLFNSTERIEIIKKALFYDLKLDKKKIEIISFTNLDEIIWFSTSDIKKIVSILLLNFLFIPAN